MAMDSDSRRSVVAALLCGLFLLSSGCQQLTTLPRSWGRKAQPPETSQLQPVELGTDQKANIQFAFARSAELRGDSEAALVGYREALQYAPERADLYHRLALLYDRKNEAAKARQLYLEALARAPGAAEIHCDAGYNAYTQRLWDEAETSLRTAIRLQPDLARAHNNLGLLLARSGRADEALGEFCLAGATESQARVNLAFALMLERQSDAAAYQLEIASAQDSGACYDRIHQLREVLRRTNSPAGTPQPADRIASSLHGMAAFDHRVTR